jgi:hypothetical protein
MNLQGVIFASDFPLDKCSRLIAKIQDVGLKTSKEAVFSRFLEAIHLFNVLLVKEESQEVPSEYPH